MGEEMKFSHRLRVRYSEIDGQKIVFNAHYLTYLDIAMSAYFEEGLQMNLADLSQKGTFDFVLAKSTLEYKKSAQLGDWLNIWCKVKKLGHTSFTMDFKITREGELDPILLAEIIYVCYDPEARTSRPVPNFIRENIIRFEKESA